MKTLTCIIALLVTITIVNPATSFAENSNVRYAIIVGNNAVSTKIPGGERLLHAEREARQLYRRLIDFGHFSPQRTILLTGTTRMQILAAAKHLGAQRRKDRKELGSLQTLFAFFYTGHGVEGELITNGKPLTGRDLASIFRTVDASLTVGFFDACYAGSLNPLRAKGVLSTPGFNPITALPDEILNAEGTMWFASSQPNQVSYEDAHLGSLFTHFFIKSFTKAQRDGVGITLENMWEFARKRTVAHAQRYGRHQTPEKLVRHLRSQGPLYFSFPRQRKARLRFGTDVSGTFVLRHKRGGLVERIVKKKGVPLEVQTFVGPARLSRITSDSQSAQPPKMLNLTASSVVEISAKDPFPTSPVQTPIRSKGDVSKRFRPTRFADQTWSMSAGYRFMDTHPTALGASHIIEAGASMRREVVTLGASLSYGLKRGSFDVWSYDLDEIGIGALAGLGRPLSFAHFELMGEARLLWHRTTYGDDTDRSTLGAQFSAHLRALVPVPLRKPVIYVVPQITWSLRLSEGTAQQDDESFYITSAPGAGISVVYPFW